MWGRAMSLVEHGRVAHYLVFCAVICPLSVFHCLSFFDLRLLITTLISSNLSFSLAIGTCDINEINEIDNAKFCEHYTFTMNYLFVCLMVFNATFNNISVISWWSVLLVGETRGP